MSVRLPAFRTKFEQQQQRIRWGNIAWIVHMKHDVDKNRKGFPLTWDTQNEYEWQRMDRNVVLRIINI